MQDILSNPLFRAALGIVVLGVGGWAVAQWVRKLSAAEDTRGQRDVEKALAKGDKAGAARIAMDNELYDKAAEIFDMLGRHADAGRALRKAEKWERAAGFFEKADDYDSAAYCYRKTGDERGLMRSLDRAGQWAEAAQMAERAGRFVEAADLLIKAGDKARAVELLVRGGDKERALALSAEARYEQGDYEGAGKAYVKLERWEDAVAAFEKGEHVELASKVYAKMGRYVDGADLLARSGRPGEAAALFEQAQRFRDAAKHWQLAGEPERAMGCLLREGDKLAVIKLRVARGEVDQALQVISTVVDTEGAYVDALRIGASLHRERGDDKAAFKALYKLLETRLSDADRLQFTREAVELAVTIGQGRIGRVLLERAAPQIGADLDAPTWAKTLKAQLAELDDAPEEMGLVQGRATGRVTLSGAVESEATQSYGEGTVAYLGGEQRAAAKSEFGIEIDADGWPKGVPISLARRYSGLERLGQGGNGVVFRANDRLLSRVVVLKFMIDGSMPTEMARKYFEREVKMAASLSHPNIVHIYDMGHEDDVPWYSMEYVEGQALSAFMPAGQIVGDKIFLMSVVEQICAALDHAHSKDMIHRDIKPDNILISSIDGAVKLLDFGLARVLDDSFGELSVLAGTPYYMAPEQIDGSPVDHRADIYALGIILYRMFTGRLPFQDGNIFVAHALEPVPDPLQFNPQLSRDVVSLLMRCLAKRPEERPDNCGSIKVGLHDALFGHLRSGVTNA
ncbi:MAG: protein kinase [Deltaproteobacteria bacterium]|nr:protein kinase [Deltaproteobacteria bacterium]